jgi:hypothetical protein
MAYKCSNCRKVSKDKKRKSLTTLMKKHRCPGCGSTDFYEINDTRNLFYDFDELVFNFIALEEVFNSNQMVSDDTIHEQTERIEPSRYAFEDRSDTRDPRSFDPPEVTQDSVRVSPSFETTPTFSSPPSFHSSPSFSDSHSPSFSDNSSSSYSSSDYSPPSDSSSSSCDCGGSCGSD